MAYYFEPPTVALITPPAVAGDLIVGRADGNFDRLAIGANGAILNISGGAIRWGNIISTGGLDVTGAIIARTGVAFNADLSQDIGAVGIAANALYARIWRASTGNDQVINLQAFRDLIIQNNGAEIGRWAGATGKLTSYAGVTAVGWGVPAVYGYGRAVGAVAQVASAAAYTVGSADGSFMISGNVLVTSTVGNAFAFTMECAYTDEGGTARVVTFNVQQLGGTLITSMTNVTGDGPYEGVPLHIRAKAATTITIRTQAAGTYTSVTFNVEGAITQIA